MASIELLQACEAIGVRRVYLPHLAIASSSHSASLLSSRRTIIFEASSLKSSAAAFFRDDGWGLERKPSAFHPHAQRTAFRSHVRPQSRSFAPRNQWLRPSPSSNRSASKKKL